MDRAIIEIIKAGPKLLKNREDLSELKRRLAKKYKLPMIQNADILKIGKELVQKNNKLSKNFWALQSILKKRAIRTMSGVAPVAVLTKAYPCPGTCAYCPHQEDVPVSYLQNEPAVMRAIRLKYDAYQQTYQRLGALKNNGHEPNKIELIIIGGTFNYLPVNYQYWYILNCFKAANDFGAKKKLREPSNNLNVLKKKLIAQQKKNETADYKVIGLTVETRPDYINLKNIKIMRDLGVTRVELGVQALDDKILSKNKRGHGVARIIEATKLLRQHGFKITYHFMPALPGSSPAKDLAMFKKMFASQDFRPDQLKFYPTVVTLGSELYNWYKRGKYKPYSQKALENLIADCKAVVPPYTRIIRLIRDIPGESIIAGNKITNLRQVMKNRGVACRCIRCREPHNEPSIFQSFNLSILKYSASAGDEYFISADSLDGQTLYGFGRLRLDKSSPVAPAIIRELHVYGQLVPVGGDKKIQHTGLGKKIMALAEIIAKNEGSDKIAVISGVGARGYYRQLGYQLKNGYMLKNL